MILKKILILVLLFTITHLSAKDMRIIGYKKGKSVQKVELKDKRGGKCRVRMNRSGDVIRTNCVGLTNSRGIRIVCTYKKRMCKTENEIFDFIQNHGVSTSHHRKKRTSLRQGMPYSQAREIILDDGWQGKNQRWQDIPDWGEVKEVYYDNGWREVQDCSGVGMAYCRFEFRNIKNQTLVVITEGECQRVGRVKCEKFISSWSIE